MALEFAEAMRIYVTHNLETVATGLDSQASLLTRYNAIGQGGLCYVDPNNGLNGGPALIIGFGGSICKTFSHQTKYTLGFRLKMGQAGGVGGGPLVSFLNGGQTLSTLAVNLDGSIFVYGNGVGGLVLAESGVPVIKASKMCYVEFTSTISGTTNMHVDTEVWINGVSVCSGGSDIGRDQNTIDSDSATFNRIFLSSGVSTDGEAYFSDMYLTNGSGTTNTGRLASNSSPYLVVGVIFTRADGSTQEWTPDMGTAHYTRIKENPYDGDGSFVMSSTPGQIDTYHWQPIASFINTVRGVQLSFIGKSTEEGKRTFQGVIGDAGTENHTAVFGLCSDYFYQHQAFDLNPVTGLPWLTPDFNAKQLGLKLVA